VAPPRLSRIQQQQATRERLMDAAAEVFGRLGYGGASVDLVAAEAGFSKGAVYSNFPNKEAMFLGLLERHMETDLAELERIVALAPGEMMAAVGHWLETMHADIDCPLLITELQLHARRSPDFAEKYYALQSRQTAVLSRILEAYFVARKRPVPLDIADLAASLTALAHGLTLQRPKARPGAPSDAGRIIEALLRALARE